MKRQLDRAYYNLHSPQSFTSASNLLKKFGKDFEKKDILKWTEGQETITKFSPAVGRFDRRPILAHDINEIFCCDTAHFARKFVKQNRGYGFFQVVVDVISRKCYAFPMRAINSLEVVKGFRKLFKTTKPSKAVVSDGGSEYKKHFKTFLAEQKLSHWVIRNETHSALAEIKIKQIKQRLTKYMYHSKTNVWYTALENVVRAINNTYTRNIGTEPSSVKTKEDARKAFLHLYSKKIGKTAPDVSLKPGQRLRISHLRKNFEKRFLQSFTDEEFVLKKIFKKQGKNILKISAHDGPVQGQFYVSEVRKIE